MSRPQRTPRSSPRRTMLRTVLQSTCNADAACSVVSTSGRSANGTYEGEVDPDGVPAGEAAEAMGLVRVMAGLPTHAEERAERGMVLDHEQSKPSTKAPPVRDGDLAPPPVIGEVVRLRKLIGEAAERLIVAAGLLRLNEAAG